MKTMNVFQLASSIVRLVVVLGLVALLLGSATPARAAIKFIIDVDPIADDNTGGGCTLREAIYAVNEGAGLGLHANGCMLSDGGSVAMDYYEIHLPSYTYTLTGASDDDDNLSGDLDINRNLNLIGEGVGNTILDGGENDRVLHINPADEGVIFMEIKAMSIQGGRVDDSGGAIYNNHAFTNIYDSLLEDHRATGSPSEENGGALYNGGDGQVRIYNSTISNCMADDRGGAIYHETGLLVVTNSTIEGNWTEHDTLDDHGGGGIYSVATLDIISSTLSNNTSANAGGGVYHASGVANIYDSFFTQNQADNGGGFFLQGGNLRIYDSIFSENQANGNGGGMDIAEERSVVIYNSTFFGNQALYGSFIFGSYGGAIHNAGRLTIHNSTLSGNKSDGSGGGIYNTNDGETTRLFNVTITDNSADEDKNGTGSGGGIYRVNGTIRLKNTIVAGNHDWSPKTGIVHPDVSGAIEGDATNLIGVLTGGGGTIGTGSDIVDPYPNLGALADNGGRDLPPTDGPTFTHALLEGSPAIDAGVDCVDISNDPLTIDQRYMPRPQGESCDIGAYETQPELSISKTVTPGTEVDYHGTVTFTIVLSNTGMAPAVGVRITDTLPDELDFSKMIEGPAGAIFTDDELVWNGTVPAGGEVRFVFAVDHVGDYGDEVENEVAYGHTSGNGSDSATFTVETEPVVVEYELFLPIVIRTPTE